MTGKILKGIFVDFRFTAVKLSLKDTPVDHYVMLLNNFVSLNDITLIQNCGFIHCWVNVPNQPIYGEDDADINVFQIVIVKPEELNLFKVSFDHLIVAYKQFKDI